MTPRKTFKIARWSALAVLALLLIFLIRYFVFWSPRDIGTLAQNGAIVIAHRGASELYPENTLAAFRAAIEAGADSIELDVILSEDGTVVVIHDDSVDRTTDGSGEVADLTLAELKALDAGSWFGPDHAGERIPTLQEAMDLAKNRIRLDIELKGTSLTPTPLEGAVAELIETNQMEGQVVVSSFNPFALFYFRRANSKISTALLYHDELAVYLRNRWFAPLAHPDGMRPGRLMVTEEHVRKLKDRGHRVVTWTVNDPDEMRRMLELGVDGIITDRPDVLRSIVDSR